MGKALDFPGSLLYSTVKFPSSPLRPCDWILRGGGAILDGLDLIINRAERSGEDRHMGHTHDHHHDPTDSSRDIALAFFLNLFFAIAEIIGGFMTNSLAILSDALHDFGDSLILGMSWVMEKNSGRPPSANFSYGYRRLSLLSALFNSVILIAGSAFIITAAIPRIMHPQEADAVGMMWFAFAGILLNGIGVLRLRKGKSMNARVVAWHLLEDVLGWAAVLIVSIVMQFTYLPVLDPILSLLIASYILYYNVFVNLNKTVRLFMQAVPDNVNVAEVTRRVQALEGVLAVHDAHVWSLDGARHVFSAHVVVKGDIDKAELIDIRNRVKELLRGAEFEHLTIEVEYDDETCNPCMQPPDTNPDTPRLDH